MLRGGDRDRPRGRRARRGGPRARTRSAATSGTSAIRRRRSPTWSRAREIAEEVGDLDDLARAYLNLSELLGAAAQPAGRGARRSRARASSCRGASGWRATTACRCRRTPPTSCSGSAAGRRPRRSCATPRSAIRSRWRRSTCTRSRAKLNVGRGAFDAAAEHLDGARRLMIKTVDPQYQAELRAREAELALWQGRRTRRARRPRPACASWPAPTTSGSSARCCGSALRARAGRARATPASLRSSGPARSAATARFVPAVTTAYALLCEAEVDARRARAVAARRGGLGRARASVPGHVRALAPGRGAARAPARAGGSRGARRRPRRRRAARGGAAGRTSSRALARRGRVELAAAPPRGRAGRSRRARSGSPAASARCSAWSPRA